MRRLPQDVHLSLLTCPEPKTCTSRLVRCRHATEREPLFKCRPLLNPASLKAFAHASQPRAVSWKDESWNIITGGSYLTAHENACWLMAIISQNLPTVKTREHLMLQLWIFVTDLQWSYQIPGTSMGGRTGARRGAFYIKHPDFAWKLAMRMINPSYTYNKRLYVVGRVLNQGISISAARIITPEG